MPVRIAIVDDHQLVREGLKTILGMAPEIEIVGEATSGAEALSLLGKVDLDVLLLDIVLPDQDGLSTLVEVRERFPDVRVLMLSMYSEPEYASAAVERGAAGLVGKDGSPEDLLRAIRVAATGGVLPVDRPLSAREREILSLIAEGIENREIARLLGLSEKTIDGHLERIMSKVGIHTRAGLVAHGRRLGLSCD